MAKIMVLHGPNLNMLGKRDPVHYGSLTFTELESAIEKSIRNYDQMAEIIMFQSNDEGSLIDMVQRATLQSFDALLVNFGAFSHYSVALRDALEIFTGVKVEVHLSDIKRREPFRQVLMTGEACDCIFSGEKKLSYEKAITFIYAKIKKIKQLGDDAQ